MKVSEPSGWFTLRWTDRGVEILDQRCLPAEEHYLLLDTVEAVARAIEDLAVRGAPAIACTAALGVALAASRSTAGDAAGLVADVEDACERLARTRPTAVNLFHALDRMRRCLHRSVKAAGGTGAAELDDVRSCLIDEASRLLVEDVETNHAIGAHGAALIPEREGGARILTHCNAGALATAGYGTALGIVRAVVAAGRPVHVLADETRPFLQGARLTAWELARDDIPVTVLTDGMAGHLMRLGEVDLVLVGADRVAANGDVANKIGTYTLAVLAREHGLPFVVAAPTTTIDLETPDGDAIPIEERSASEVLELGGVRIAPEGVGARHPAFDVTPAAFVSVIVTEEGVARAPYVEALRSLCARARLRA